jgi:hypothetical protein
VGNKYTTHDFGGYNEMNRKGLVKLLADNCVITRCSCGKIFVLKSYVEKENLNKNGINGKKKPKGGCR